MTECSSGEEAQKKTDSAVSPNFGWKNQSNGWAKTIWQSNQVSPTRFETMKLMNLKQKEAKLELKMARVAENKQRILEERKERARRSYESFFNTQRANSCEDQNGWEKAPNGYVKVFKPLKSVPSAKYKKFSKDDLDQKMAKVALRKQMILEEKKQKARKFMTPRHQSFKVLDDMSNQVDRVSLFNLPKPCVSEETLTKLVDVQKLIQDTTQMLMILKKQETELIEKLANQAADSQMMSPDDFELI